MNTSKKIIIAITSVLCTYLFFKQGLGLNLFIMSLTLSILALWNDHKTKPLKTLIYLCILNSISFSAFHFGDGVSIFFSIVGIFLIPFFTFDTNKIAILALPKQLWNNVKISMELVYKGMDMKYNQGFSKSKIFSIVFIPLLIISVFVVLYCIANPNFASIVQQIMSIINFDLVLFFAFAVFISVVFWNYKQNNSLEEKYKRYITAEFDSDVILATRNENTNNWFTSGIILFGFLDIILSVFIATEYVQIAEIKNTIHNISSVVDKPRMILDIFDAVLSSVTTIIISIVFAITLIFSYFKKHLNFNSPNKTLHYLAYLWIILNSLILITAGFKVWLSINFSGYTIKRLGVYVFLLLSFIGLIFTYLKLYYKKTNFYVVRKMVWAFAIALAITSPINWSSIITAKNYELIQNENKPIEIWRLIYEIDYNHIELNPYLKLKNLSPADYNLIQSKIKLYPLDHQTSFQEQTMYDNIVKSYYSHHK